MIRRVQLQGSRLIHLEERNLAEGLYLAQVRTGKEVQTSKIIFSRQAPGGA